MRNPWSRLEKAISVIFWTVIVAVALVLTMSFCKAMKAKGMEATVQELPVVVPITMSMEMKPVVRPLPVCGKAPVYIEAEVVVAEEPEPVEIPEPTYTEEELEALALAIYQEAGADAYSDETRLMVGTVVLNRVADDRYPDTLQEVLMEKSQYGRLHWTGLVWPERASLPEEAHAVERAYNLAEALLSGSVTDVLPADVVFQAEFIQGTEVVAEVPGIYFCR